MFGDLPAADDTIRWLVNRQINDDEDKGGFNGRVNKPGDTCYSFWVRGALDVSPFDYIDIDPQRRRIYLCRMESHISPRQDSTFSTRRIWKGRGCIPWYPSEFPAN